ncbi:UbiA family prenyltransferase [Streptomyces profundus]|uniref:UbiA family prenyltransferase n=1 Tax=Streptomyces profundus TaxID=2867410 RepID=UPI001D1628A5|nr:UbiA family prenyltransferase [Streptomyces sp. MA3_2.13]UED85451.1 UbiA family prenyltransferase [Streptomyces sp. MA3_2.13]
MAVNTVRTGEPDVSPRTNRLKAYAKLGKLAFFDFYLCVLLVWAALPGSQLWDWQTFALLALFVLGQGGVVAATVAFDDLTGLRDGSDARNYQPETGQLRDLSRKPLLSGSLTARQAWLFGWGAVAWGLVIWSATALLAPHQPLWVCALLLLTVVLAVQYSYGLKLSYHGAQELLLLFCPAMVVLLPYGLLTGTTTGLIILEALLFGLWSLLVSLYSNMNDVEGDRLARRRNLATLTSPANYRRVIVAFTVLEPVAVLVAWSLGAVPGWFLLVLAPVLASRAVQLRTGVVQGNALAARVLGIRTQRIGVISFVIGNLLAVHLI